MTLLRRVMKWNQTFMYKIILGLKEIYYIYYFYFMYYFGPFALCSSLVNGRRVCNFHKIFVARQCDVDQS